ncbi:TRZ/ATZ family hydrolase [Luminiphilus sp. nBUS_16]|uniref:TRZ/ATZ family hydrolase n=1 Tax=Luminiphilus sp. nBUS_16 TaxID=3395315 RepID=UPI003EBC8A49
MTQHNPSFAADLVIHPEWIVPVVPKGVVLTGHSVIVNDGGITGIVPTEEARKVQAIEHLNLPTQALLPGLINAHGHSPMTLLRGFADDAPLMTWLQDHIWPLEAEFVSEAFVRDGTDLALLELVMAGTTTFSDMYFFPEVTAQRADLAGLRAQLVFPVIDVATAWAGDSEACLDKGLALRDEYRDHALIQLGIGAHSTYSVPTTTLQKIATLLHELDAPLQIHLHETENEVTTALKTQGERPINLLDRLGLLGPRTQCVHMTALSDYDIGLLANSNSHVIHCPRSNMKLASGISPVDRLLKAGINVALGTDGAASNNRLSMLAELQMAALLAKVETQEATALSATAALEIATLGGARALGLETEVGSIEPGKAADLIAIDLSQPHTQPLNNVISQVVYATNGSELTHSWVAGQAVVRDGQPLTLAPADILARAASWPKKFRAHQGFID